MSNRLKSDGNSTRLRAAAGVRSILVNLRYPLYMNAYALMFSNVLTSGLGIVYWGLAARFYTPSAVGTASAVISASLFVTGISQLNLRVALMRLVPEAGEHTARLVISGYAVSILMTVATGLLVLLGLTLLAPESPLLASLGSFGAAAFIAGTTSWTIFNLQDGVLTGLRRAIWVPVENAIYSASKILLLVLFVTWTPPLGILGSWFIPMAVVVAIVSIALARWVPQHAASTRQRSFVMGRRTLLGFIAGDYLASLISLGVATLLPLTITVTLGPREGAYFYVVWIIGNSLNLLPIHTCASMTVEALQEGTDVQDVTRRVALHLARILLPISLVVGVSAPLILTIFGDDYAANGSNALRLIALAVLPFAANVMTIAIARIRGRASDIVLIQGAIAVLTLALTAILLGPLGISGVALAWLLAQLSVAAFVLPLRIVPLIRSAAEPRPSQIRGRLTRDPRWRGRFRR